MSFRKNVTERGSSIIEVLAVLAVIGMVGMGLLSGYNYVMGKFNTSKIVTHAQALMKTLSTYFSSYRIYPAMSATQLFGLGFLNADYYDEQTHKAMHPFEGEITFSTKDNGLRYSFTYHDLPGNVCVAMATMDIPVANLYSIKIGDHTARMYPEPGVAYKQTVHLPFVMSEAAKECGDVSDQDSKGNDNDIDIEFTFM